MHKTSLLFGVAAAALSFALSTASFADDAADIKAKAEDYTKTEVAKWVADADVVAALSAANSSSAAYDQGKIDELDKQWRAEVGAAAHPLIDQVMASSASAKAKSWCSSGGGVVTEVIIMDNKGLNVGICDATSDYWQGDEPKWQRAFLEGKGAVFIDRPRFDDSSSRNLAQISVPVMENGRAIGVITIGVTIDKLK